MSTTTRQFNPFPGLRPFNTEEDYLFFGREEQVTELLKLLRQHRFIGVVGTSGSGKSSLVRAGLLPALHGGTMAQAGSRWEVLLLRPGGDPITSLAQSLIDADLYDADDEESLPRLKATLDRSRLGLVEAIKQSDMPEGSNLLVVVDQFEELFRFRQTGTGHQETAGAFVKLLLAASQQSDQRIFVTITMRSDYLGECAEIPGLAEAVNDGEYLIPRLKREQRRAAIEMPVSVGGGKIATRLVQKLLNDVGDDADQLPVLQHALMRIWDDWAADHQDDEPLDLRHYESIGGLHEALSRHADEVFAALASDRLRTVTEKSFKALTERGSDNRGIRRPTRLDQICAIVDAEEAEVEAVVSAFRQAGRTFLMPMEHVDLSPETVVDISHESLMRVWQRLSRWVEEESQSARIYRRLADTAVLHAEGKAGVYHDPDLNIALTWRETSQPTDAWAERYHAGFDQAMAFLDESSEAKLAAERQREEARQRELAQAKELAAAQRLRAEEQQRSASRLRGMLVVMAVVALFAMGAFFVALAARREAQKNAVLAQQNAEFARANEVEAVTQAERAHASELLALENEAKAKQQEQLAEDRAETIRKSLYVSEINGAGNAWHEAFGIERVKRILNNTQPTPGEDDLRGWEWYHLLSLCHRDEMLFPGGNALLAAAWSPDGSHVATGTYQGGNVIRVWDARTTELLATLDDHTGPVWSICWSPDGQRFASASGDQTVRIWNVNTLEKDAILRGHTGGVRSVDWSPDGKRLATSSNDGSARIWEISTGKTIRILLGHTDTVSAIQWNSDGTRLATGSSDQSVKIWDSSGKLLSTITGHSDSVRSLEWSPDDRFLASSGADRTAQVWDVATGESQFEIPGETQWNTVAWSPSGEQLATSVSGSVDVYDFASRRLLQRFSGHEGPMRAIDWNAEGDRLLSASFDGNCKIWRVGGASEARTGQEHLTLVGHGQIRGAWLPVAWSHDGTQLATADADGVIRVWDTASGQQTSTIAGHTEPVLSVAWHPDGQRLASGSEDRSVRIWQVADGVELEMFRTNTDHVRSVAWSPDGTRLAWGSADTTITVWTPGDQDRATSLFLFSGGVQSVAWSPDAKRLAAVGGQGNSPGAIKVWDLDTGNEARTIALGTSGIVYSVAWSPDGSKFATGGANGSIILSDANTGAEIASLLGRTDDVAVVAWSPDGTRLASAGDNSSVHIWDVATGREILALQGHQGPLDSVAWRPDGFQLASGSTDGTVKIWDAATGYLKAGSPVQLSELTGQIEGGVDNALNRRMRGEILAIAGEWDQAVVDFKRAAELDPEASPVFQTGWWAAGPYSQDIMTNGPPTKAPDPFRPPLASELSESDENSLYWHPVGQRPDGHLNFRQLNVSGDNVASLAVTRVYASTATEVVAFYGDDDRLNIWLNGELIHEGAYEGGAAAPDEDMFLVTLREGWNTMLFAVANGRQGHQMYFRLSDEPVDLAKAYIAAGRIRDAVELVEQARAADPGSLALDRMDLAQAYIAAGRYREAVELVEQARTADPANVALSLQAANLYLQLSNQDPAAADLESSHNYRGKARDIYQDALNRQPNSASISRRLARLLVDDVGWTVIQPVETTSSGGATLTLLPDSSVLASGKDPATDTYTIEAETDLQGITGFRIEALPDDSLPMGGPGRRGNFVMSGIELFAIADEESNEDTPIAIAGVKAEFHQPKERLPEILNPDSPKGWGIWPRTGVSTSALFVLEKPIDRRDGRRFKIKLHFSGNPSYPNHTLGRFRLAATNAPQPHIIEGDSGEDSSVGVILGIAYLSVGDATSAIGVLRESIARNEGSVALEHLCLAKAHLRLGQTQEASDELQRAATLMHNDGADERLLTVAAETLTEAIEKGLNDARWLKLRATVYARLGERAQAREDYRTALEVDPANSDLSDRIALLDQNIISHWDFDFAADDWSGEDGSAVSSADGYIRVLGPGDLRSMSVSTRLREGWQALTMRVRSPEPTSGRIHLGSTSQPFDISALDVTASESEWDELKLFLNTSMAANSLRLEFGPGEAPVEIDQIAIFKLDLENETDAILAQLNDRVAEYPDDAQVFVARARLFSALQQADDAEADYARAYELAADDPDLMQELAQANLSFDSSAIVPAGVTWKYWHPSDGTDPADDDPDFHETFANLDYDDNHWSSGKDIAGPGGGFGYDNQGGAAVSFEQPQQANRHSAYFRHAFETDEPREDLLLYLQRDDGVIVYLDGREVQRDNVEPGPEAYRLAAQRTISGSDEERVMVLRLPGTLDAGKHVLAISLHNRGGGSSDLRIAEISLRGAPITKATDSTNVDESQ